MTGKLIVVHASEEPDVNAWQASIFLVGPNPRDTSVPSWRPAAVKALERHWKGPGILAVFAPEGRGWKPLKYNRFAWEDRWLSTVDVIAFWVPRNMATMPALNTNIEFGRWESSQRLVFGAPPEANHVSYLQECARRVGAPVQQTLEDTMTAAIAGLHGGAHRTGAERDIPLLLWRTSAFQSWLANIRQSGDSFDGGRLAWVHRNDGLDDPKHWAFEAVINGRPRLVLCGDGRNAEAH